MTWVRTGRVFGLAALPIVILAVLVNLETIRTFPSWFDEAFFANMAFNLAQGQGLVLDVIPGYFQGEVFLYGPVYFHLQAFLINFFGLQDFIFRLPNLAAAYLSVLVLAFVLRESGLSPRYQILFVVAAIVDVSFNRNLVSGRMDMMAVLFVALSLWLAGRQPARPDEKALLRWILVGTLAAAAYLTTPRALFLLPVVFVIGLQRLVLVRTGPLREANWVGSLAAVIAFVIPVLLWVQHVGGVHAYASIFSGNPTAASHIAPSFFRSSYDNIAIGLMLALCVINYKLVLKNALLSGLVLTYVAFSLFVKEVGPYAAMIMPFILATIVLLIAQSQWGALPKFFLVSLITLPGLVLLGLRGVDVYLNAECRDSNKVLAIASGVLGDRDRVVAPFKYYFLLEHDGRDLVTLAYSKIGREQLVNDADLVIENKQLPDWLAEAGLEKAAQVSCEPRRVPFLPGTFYQRSVFDEGFYRR